MLTQLASDRKFPYPSVFRPRILLPTERISPRLIIGDTLFHSNTAYVVQEKYMDTCRMTGPVHSKDSQGDVRFQGEANINIGD